MSTFRMIYAEKNVLAAFSEFYGKQKYTQLNLIIYVVNK